VPVVRHRERGGGGVYTSIFPNSGILQTAYYGEAGPRPAGTVMTVTFELDGRRFVALDGGPQFTFSEAISGSTSRRSRRPPPRRRERPGQRAMAGSPAGSSTRTDRMRTATTIAPKANTPAATQKATV
jgi:hypothetical protein